MPSGFNPWRRSPKEFIGLLDLMIDVDEEDAVEAAGGQLGILRLAKTDADIVEILAVGAERQPVADFRKYIFGKDAPRMPTARDKRTV
jgi:hypothetical protein